MMQKPPRIVFIENNQGLREVIELSLIRIGKFVTEGYGDAFAALDAIVANPPDAILVDAANVDGAASAFLKALRAEDSCRHVPVILASDRKRVHQIRRYKAIGATAILPTPINPFSLPQAVQAVLAQQSSPAEVVIQDAASPIFEHLGVTR